MAFFKQRNVLTAIEIGTSKICVLIGELDEDESVNILGYGERTLSREVLKGEIVDMEAVNELLYNAICDAESNANINIGKNSVYVAVTGSHITSQLSNGSVMITGENNTVTDEHIAEATAIAKMLRLSPENKTINYFDSYYLIDGKRQLATPAGHIAHKLDAFGLLIYGDLNRIENFKSVINEIGIESHIETVFSPVAAAYTGINKEEYKEGVVLIDMGAGTTEFIIVKDHGVRYCEVITIGCNHIANDLSIGLDIS